MQRSNLFFLIIILFVFSIILIGFYAYTMNKDNKIILMPNDESLLSLGQKIYLQNCASCHGVKLEGQKNWQTRDDEGYLLAPPHDETGHTWHHTDEYLFLMIRRPPRSTRKESSAASDVYKRQMINYVYFIWCFRKNTTVFW